MTFIQAKTRSHSLIVHRFLICFILFIIMQLKYPLAQTEASQDLYESRKFQLEFLLQESHKDTQTTAMILEEAEYFAREGDFHIALDLLDMAMEELTDSIFYQL